MTRIAWCSVILGTITAATTAVSCAISLVCLDREAAALFATMTAFVVWRTARHVRWLCGN